MCDDDFFDDAAFWGGLALTQSDGEREEQDPGDPSPEDTLATDLDYLDEEDQILLKVHPSMANMFTVLGCINISCKNSQSDLTIS